MAGFGHGAFITIRSDELWESDDVIDAQRSTLDASTQAEFRFEQGLFQGLGAEKVAESAPFAVMPWESVLRKGRTQAGDACDKFCSSISLASTESPASSISLLPDLSESFSQASSRVSSLSSLPPLCMPPPGLRLPAAPLQRASPPTKPAGFRPPPGLELQAAPVEVPPPPAPSQADAECSDDACDTLPSKGSRHHCHGTCTPCKFFRGHRGCLDGENCELCHFPHEELTYSAIRRNLKKKAVKKGEPAAAPAAAEPEAPVAKIVLSF